MARLYLTGRSRTLRIQGTLSMPARIVYYVNQAAFVWVASSGHLVDSAGTKTLYPAVTSTTLVTGGRDVGYGFRDGVTNRQVATFFVPTATADPNFADASNWLTFDYTATVAFDWYAEVVEVVSETGQYSERMKPGSSYYNRYTWAGGTVTSSSGTIGGTDYTQTPNIPYLYQARLLGCETTHAIRDLTPGPTDVATYNASGPSLGIDISVDDSTGWATSGMVNGTGLSVSSPIGTGDWDTLTLDKAATGNRELRAARYEVRQGNSPFITRISGTLRRMAAANTQACDVIVASGAASAALTGITGSFSQDLPGGGYQISARWLGNSTTYTDTDTTVPGTPAGMDAKANLGSSVSTHLGAGATPYLQARPPYTQAAVKLRQVTSKRWFGHTGVMNTWATGSGSKQWAASPGSVSVVGSGSGSYLHIVAGSGTIAGTNFDTAAVSAFRNSHSVAFRTVRIRFKASADNSPLRLKWRSFDLNGDIAHEVTSGLAGVWEERDIDLFDPDHGTSRCDLPVFHRVYGFEFVGMTSGVSYDIEWIDGIRNHDANVSVLHPGFAGELMGPLHGFSDGHLSANLWYQNATMSSNTAPSNIADVETRLETNHPWMGWECDLLCPAVTATTLGDGNQYIPISDIINRSAPANWIGGYGLFPDNSLTLDKDARAENATSGAALSGNPAFFGNPTGITFYPGAGAVITGGSYSDIIEVPFSGLFHGQVIGCLITPSGSVVVTEQGTGDPSGSGGPTSGGFFATGAPWVEARLPHQASTTAILHDVDPTASLIYWFDGQTRVPSVADTVEPFPVTGGNGRRWYVRIYVDSVAGWLSADINKMWRAVRAYRQDDTIFLAFADLPDASTWTEQDTGIDGERPCIRYGRGVSDGRIVLVYEDTGGGISRQHTLDEGQTWDVATTIFSTGKFPLTVETPTGVEHHFCREDGADSIKTRVLDAQQQQIIAETTVIASGVEEDAIAGYYRDGYVYLMYHATGGAITTVRSNDGITYT